MGTFVEINIPMNNLDVEVAERACDAAEQRISQLDRRLSLFSPSSELSRINNDREKIFHVNAERAFSL